MNSRIKAIRKSDRVNLNQEAFGRKLGVTGAAISRIESGERGITEQIIISICQTFDVNEKWLRTGNGNMFIDASDDEQLIERVLKESGENPTLRALLTTWSRLSEPNRLVLEQFVEDFVAEATQQIGMQRDREDRAAVDAGVRGESDEITEISEST